MNYDEKIINRVKRIEGQVRGLLKMMEEEKDCKDVIVQMTAARAALDRTAALVVSTNLDRCIRIAKENGEDSDALIQEAVNLLVKSR